MTAIGAMRRRLNVRCERGVAAVEFALVSMVFMLFLFGIITYGFIFGLQHNLTHAASEGARSALKAVSGSEVATAESRAASALSFETAKDNAVIDAQIVTGDGCEPTNANIRCIRVTISLNYGEHPVVPSLMGIGTPEMMTAEATVQLE